MSAVSASAPRDPRGAESGDGRRERKKQQTRDALHEAAFRLVQENGLDGTTIEQICLEADVSTRTFFNYYPSKAAAVLGLPDEAVDHDAQERFRAATGSIADALCDVIMTGDRFRAGRARVKQLVIQHPDLLPVMTTMMSAARGRFVDLVAERAASREEAELTVTLVFAAVGVTLHSLDDSSVLTADLLRSTLDALVRARSALLED